MCAKYLKLEGCRIKLIGIKAQQNIRCVCRKRTTFAIKLCTCIFLLFSHAFHQLPQYSLENLHSIQILLQCPAIFSLSIWEAWTFKLCCSFFTDIINYITGSCSPNSEYVMHVFEGVPCSKKPADEQCCKLFKQVMDIKVIHFVNDNSVPKNTGKCISNTNRC